jgi:hypothetical protein
VAAVPDAEPEVAGAEPEAVPDAEPLGAVVPARGALEPDDPDVVPAALPVPLPLVLAPLPEVAPLAGGGIWVVPLAPLEPELPPLDDVAWAVTAARASEPAATVAKNASLMS